MKAFYCTCGWRVFFENTQCLGCGRRLGFDPGRGSVVALDAAEGDVYPSASVVRPRRYRLCRNYRDHQICNWLVAADAAHDYCLACGLNEVIPSLAQAKNYLWWRNMEAAKRRLLYTLLKLDLPVVSKQDDPRNGLAFAFLQDRRHNPAVEHEMVLTGHNDGLITVNVMEADDAARESQRIDLNESYRTLLGHFRHESGHYYWERVVKGNGLLDEFRGLFGDEREHYASSLRCYYVQAGNDGWPADYISAYARAHPWEDWAETWAHYLHMVDGLETACVFSITKVGPDKDKFQQCLTEWAGLMVMLNELNRSVGQYDAYPFFLSERIANKLHFVHRTIHAAQRTRGFPVGPQDV
ncbi:MAG: zinc-binding metallopeptidase family protein [Gammaproteobacteria bacterium]